MHTHPHSHSTSSFLLFLKKEETQANHDSLMNHLWVTNLQFTHAAFAGFCQNGLFYQVFMSLDEPDAGSQETPSGEDGTPTMTTVVPPVAVPQEERPLVEFDSPDSGLPSSRNYSVTSAHSQILSSIDDGQSTEEEGVGGEEVQSTGMQAGHQDSLTEEKLCSQLDKLVTSGASADVVSPSLSSYTVRHSNLQS